MFPTLHSQYCHFWGPIPLCSTFIPNRINAQERNHIHLHVDETLLWLKCVKQEFFLPRDETYWLWSSASLTAHQSRGASLSKTEHLTKKEYKFWHQLLPIKTKMKIYNTFVYPVCATHQKMGRKWSQWSLNRSNLVIASHLKTTQLIKNVSW